MSHLCVALLKRFSNIWIDCAATKCFLQNPPPLFIESLEWIASHLTLKKKNLKKKKDLLWCTSMSLLHSPRIGLKYTSARLRGGLVMLRWKSHTYSTDWMHSFPQTCHILVLASRPDTSLRSTDGSTASVCPGDTFLLFHLCYEGLNNHNELFGLARASILYWLERCACHGHMWSVYSWNTRLPHMLLLESKLAPVESSNVSWFIFLWIDGKLLWPFHEMVPILTVADSQTEMSWIILEDDPSNGWETMALKKQCASLILSI